MDRRDLLLNIANLARKKGSELARKHGRPLGEKLAKKLSEAGVERGMLQDPLSLDDIIARLQALRNNGGISSKDFAKLKQLLRERFSRKQS